MAFSPYTPVPAENRTLAGISDAHQYNSGVRNMLTYIGDYWRTYFPEEGSLKDLAAGTVSLFSFPYDDIVQRVLCSSILDIPTHIPRKASLFIFNSERAERTVVDGRDAYVYPAEGARWVGALTSSLFEPEVRLIQGEHFDVDEEADTFLFYVDVFRDKEITGNAYSEAIADARYTVLWGVPVVFSEQYIQERFGRFLYSRKEVNSAEYKDLLTALQYFFVSTKSRSNLETIINIIMGLPFSRRPGETVTGISDPEDGQVRVRTTKTEYIAPASAELMVAEGDRLDNYELIARFHRVLDYVDNPGWYDNVRLPRELVPEGLSDELISQLQADPTYRMLFSRITSYHDGVVDHSGYRRYVGDSSESMDAEQIDLSGFMVSSDAIGPLGDLYDFVDKFLKYNLIGIRTEFDYDSYTPERARITKIREIIEAGLPVYLFPIIETWFRSRLEDTVPEVDDSEWLKDLALLPFQETVSVDDDSKVVVLQPPNEDTFVRQTLGFLGVLHDNSAVYDGSRNHYKAPIDGESLRPVSGVRISDTAPGGVEGGTEITVARISSSRTDTIWGDMDAVTRSIADEASVFRRVIRISMAESVEHPSDSAVRSSAIRLTDTLPAPGDTDVYSAGITFSSQTQPPYDGVLATVTA